jgi:hypothetical protein
MALKRLVISTSAISETNFRSLVDVEKMLNAIGEDLDQDESLLQSYEKQFARLAGKSFQKAASLEFEITPRAANPKIKLTTIDSFSVPNLDLLKRNFDVVNSLWDKLDQLRALSNSVTVNFRGVKGSEQMLKNIQDMQKRVQDQISKALDFLEKVGKEYAPKPFKKLIVQTLELLGDQLQYDSYTTRAAASTNIEGHMTFTVWVQLKNLRDEAGNVHPEFFLVFTCILRPGETKAQLDAAYYVTVLHEFATPGKFSPGKNVKNATQASNAIGALLSLENVANDIGTLPHNLDPAAITKSKFSVAKRINKIQVDEGSLTFVLMPNLTEAVVENTFKALYLEVRSLMNDVPGISDVGPDGRKTAPKVKLKMRQKTVDGQPAVTFLLANLAKDNQINVHELEFLKQQYGLDDQKLRQVTRIING